MNEEPLLSLLILTYRQVRFVREAVMSALSQDYVNLEIVISDDASNDGTIEIVRDCVRDYRGPHRVVINENKCNLGIGAHMRKACALCHGDWIITQGGDDISLPNRLRVTADYIQRYPSASAIGVSAVAIDEEGHEIEDSHAVDEPKIYPRYQGGQLTTSQNPGDDVSFVMLIGAMAAYRRDVIALSEISESSIAEDVVFSWRASLLGDIICVPERCVQQRINKSSITRSGRKSRKRRDRQASRRRVERIIYNSFDALINEARRYPFEVPPQWLAYVRCARSRSLLLCLPFDYTESTLDRYASALDSADLNVWILVKKSSRYGNTLKLLWLLLRLSVRKIFFTRRGQA